MMQSVSRKIHFCSGHRVLGHESKCANLHGHNYVAWIYARAKKLDNIGRVIDFSVLKDLIGGWIHNKWDHNMLIYNEDTQYKILLSGHKGIVFTPFNPTAENMAHYLLSCVCPDLLRQYEIDVYKVVLYETENCFAEVEED